MRLWLAGKLHEIRVTDKSVRYEGSVTIGRDLMEAAQIGEYEQVHVVNLANGARWITYAIVGPPGVFTLNGGGARLGERGDMCVVMTYVYADKAPGGMQVYCDEHNRVIKRKAIEA